MNRRLFCLLVAGVFAPKVEGKEIRIFYWSPSKNIDKFVFVDEKEKRIRILSFLGRELEDDWSGPLSENVSECFLRDGKWISVVVPFEEYLKDLGYEEIL